MAQLSVAGDARAMTDRPRPADNPSKTQPGGVFFMENRL
jgi:hypothetical protein